MSKRSDFCQGFFHINECFEWKQPAQCLDAKPCIRTMCKAFVHITDAAGKTLFSKKYENIKNAFEFKQVEEIIAQDQSFIPILQDCLTRPIITIYMSYQPYLPGKNYCTAFLQLYHDSLKQFDPILKIKICDLSSIHWEIVYNHKNTNRQIAQRQAMRKRLKSLMSFPNIEVNAMKQEDWNQLMGFYCFDKLEINTKQWEKRLMHDSHIAEFLANKL